MARSNIALKIPQPKTFEGATASKINERERLERLVMSCLLFEDTFYRSGKAIADAIAEIIKMGNVKQDDVAILAIRAREDMHLRHVPLYMAVCMLRAMYSPSLVGNVLHKIIQRADEPGEFIAMYFNNGRQHIPHQIRLALSACLKKFDTYQLAKYNRKTDAVKLRDVVKLCHPVPDTKAQSKLFKQILKDTLPAPDTWERLLSEPGADKAHVFTKLMKDGKLGDFAFLRNLRGMFEAGVSERLILSNFKGRKFSKILPFRFLSAGREIPRFEKSLEDAMLESIEGLPKLRGTTGILIDVSGSMVGAPISERSKLDRRDAASALAVLVNGICGKAHIGTFSDSFTSIPRIPNGFSLVKKISEVYSGGTHLSASLSYAILNTKGWAELDRLIVITDEQTRDILMPAPAERSYIVNVASYENGIGYRNGWHHINGFSERIIDFIILWEQSFFDEPAKSSKRPRR